jgi:hypothetical protein
MPKTRLLMTCIWQSRKEDGARGSGTRNPRCLSVRGIKSVNQLFLEPFETAYVFGPLSEAGVRANNKKSEYLRKAEDADRQAAQVVDPEARAAWLRIAGSYRDLAVLVRTPP